MKKISLFTFMLFATAAFSQAPKLYLHIVSHNEPTDNLQNALNFNLAKDNALQMATIVDSKNAKWNLQTSDGFILGALQYQSAGTSSTDVFETLANAPYSDNIEIDPRPKNMNGRNIADQWYLLDSCGANPSHHLGGFICSTTDPTNSPIDWWQYESPKVGNIYGNSWQCDALTGPGSYPPHQSDVNDFGIFKPDTTTNFYHHNANRNVWCIGGGCAPVLDSLDDEQAIIDQIQGQVDSIQAGLWPSNKFYVTRIMTNQRQYGHMFFQKITKVIDSVNAIGSTKIEWATIGEVFTAFQAWQQTPSDYSQWLCGETATTTKITEQTATHEFNAYPNPSTGTFNLLFDDHNKHLIEVYNSLGSLLMSQTLNSSEQLILNQLPNGIYNLKVDKNLTKIIVKE